MEDLKFEDVKLVLEPTKVKDSVVTFTFEKKLTEDQKCLISTLLRNYKPERSKAHFHTNQLVDFDLGGKVKPEYYYSMYFFFEENRIMIITGNGNFSLILKSFNEWVEENRWV